VSALALSAAKSCGSGESNGVARRKVFVSPFSPRPDRALLRRIHEAPALAAVWCKQVAK